MSLSIDSCELKKRMLSALLENVVDGLLWWTLSHRDDLSCLFFFDAFIFSMLFSDTDSNNLIFSFGWLVETAFSLRLKDWN